MIKFSQTAHFDPGVEPTAIIHSSNGLTKRASSENLLPFEKTKGQTDLHIIALGAYEGTGFNRNMDAFLEKWCEKNAHYFTDADRAVHRHHKNKPQDPKYGNIKAAAYNKKMKRIELIVGLDNEKCADIINEQEKKGSTNWSMASKQAYDVCTWCNHKAKNDSERCDHIPNKLGQLNKQGQLCGMENPDPKWFEISYVHRPADRIGVSLQKVASNLEFLLPKDYLQIYTGFVPPDDEVILSKTAADKRTLLNKLSAMEKRVQAVGKDIKNVAPMSGTDKLASKEIAELREFNPPAFFKAAADNGIILGPENFFNYVLGEQIKTAQIEGAKTYLPEIFAILEKEASELLNFEGYDPVGDLPLAERNYVSKLATRLSLSPVYAASRVKEGLIAKTAGHRQITKNAEHKELAKQYALYKLSALRYLESKGALNEDILSLAVTQNVL